MRTDADLPEFHTALGDALTEASQLERLLAYPEFRDRLTRICRWIARHDEVPELVDEVCLKILKRETTYLPPYQTEYQFFGWLAVLAKNVYRNQKRDRLTTMTCTESAKQWPKSAAAIPDSRIDEYMDHVEECAYHRELMFLEQQQGEHELRAVFRRARGLDSQGRLLRGELLKTTIADHERCQASWKKEGQITDLPFNHIALYNGDKQIASCGRFFDFSRHESINELDPQAGLQIRGVSNVENKDVLLGFYPLAGVRHEGTELLLDLGNGYTVGLGVVRLKEKTFAVEFRCVETETLEDPCSVREYTSNAEKNPPLGDAGNSSKAIAKRSNWTWSNSLPNSLARPSLAVQICALLFVIGLAFENVTYLNQWLTTKFTQQAAVGSIHALVNRLQRSAKPEDNFAATRTNPGPQASVPHDLPKAGPKVVDAVKPLAIKTRTEAVNNEHQNAAPKKLIKYTSKAARIRNSGFRGVALVPDPFNSKKLSNICAGKDPE